MFPFMHFYPQNLTPPILSLTTRLWGRARRGERAGEEGREHRNLCWAVKMSGCRCGPARWHVSSVPREGMGHCNLPNKLGKGSREKSSFLRLVHAQGAAVFASGTFSDARGGDASKVKKGSSSPWSRPQTRLLSCCGLLLALSLCVTSF